MGRLTETIKIEDLHRLDVRRCVREGLLAPGNRFQWSWGIDAHSPDVSCAVIIRVINRQTIIIDYWIIDFPHVGALQRNLPVTLTATPCNYGGCRNWFSCPYCGRRAAHLYFSHNLWVCRSCAGASYTSQSESKIDRLWRKQSKIEKILNNGSKNRVQPVKPRGMHRCTFDRLCDSLERVQEERHNQCTANCG